MLFPTWALVLIVLWELCGVVAALALVWLLVAALRGSKNTRLPKRIALVSGGLFLVAGLLGAIRGSSSSSATRPDRSAK